MNPSEAAARWKRTWETAWPRKDVAAIAGLYSTNALYRALAFRDADVGIAGVRDYLQRNFDVEIAIECWFGDPIIDGDRAAIEWWGTWIEEGRRLTLAGATMLRFDERGNVVDHRDYWNETPNRVEPYDSYL